MRDAQLAYIAGDYVTLEQKSHITHLLEILSTLTSHIIYRDDIDGTLAEIAGYCKIPIVQRDELRTADALINVEHTVFDARLYNWMKRLHRGVYNVSNEGIEIE
jgi:hypothetical protein